MEISLPTQKVKASRVSPKSLIIYAPPKTGKTTIISQLDNCLLLDLENGSDFVDALKLKVNSLKDLYEIGEEIKKQGKPYKRIAIDTISALENWCEDSAKKLYMETPIGKNFKGKSVLELANGGGYLWLRIAFNQWRTYIETLADEIIFIGHLKEKMIDVQGKEVNAKDIDLTGKLKSITCSVVDAVGYLYRENGKLMITFKSTDEIVCGSRCDHLRGQEFEFDWKKIYVD